MKKNNSELKFSALKIKKIIQDNKEIGKIANMTPFVISKSLEYFIKEVLGECATSAKDNGSNKVHPFHMKKVILDNPDFRFLAQLVDDIPEENNKKQRTKKEKEKEKSKPPSKDN